MFTSLILIKKAHNLTTALRYQSTRKDHKSRILSSKTRRSSYNHLIEQKYNLNVSHLSFRKARIKVRNHLCLLAKQNDAVRYDKLRSNIDSLINSGVDLEFSQDSLMAFINSEKFKTYIKSNPTQFPGNHTGYGIRVIKRHIRDTVSKETKNFVKRTIEIETNSISSSLASTEQEVIKPVNIQPIFSLFGNIINLDSQDKIKTNLDSSSVAPAPFKQSLSSYEFRGLTKKNPKLVMSLINDGCMHQTASRNDSFKLNMNSYLAVFSISANKSELLYTRFVLNLDGEFIERQANYNKVQQTIRHFFFVIKPGESPNSSSFDSIKGKYNKTSGIIVTYIDTDTFSKLIQSLPIIQSTSAFIFPTLSTKELAQVVKSIGFRLNPGYVDGRDHISPLQFRLADLLIKLGFTIMDIFRGSISSYSNKF